MPSSSVESEACQCRHTGHPAAGNAGVVPTAAGLSGFIPFLRKMVSHYGRWSWLNISSLYTQPCYLYYTTGWHIESPVGLKRKKKSYNCCHGNSGLLRTRETWSSWSRPSRELQNWSRNWGISVMRKGWRSWACSVSRGDDWEGTSSIPTGIWRKSFSLVPRNSTRVNGQKLRHMKFHLNIRKNFTVWVPSTGIDYPERLWSLPHRK